MATDYNEKYWGASDPAATLPGAVNDGSAQSWVDSLSGGSTAQAATTRPSAAQDPNAQPATPASSAGPTTTPTSDQVIQDLGIAAAPAPTPPAASNSPAPSYEPLVQAVQSATTPQETLAAQDALARSVMSSLTAAGHKVTWDGYQMTVDGAPYELPTSSATAQPAGIVTSHAQADPSTTPPIYTDPAAAAAADTSGAPIVPGGTPNFDERTGTYTQPTAPPPAGVTVNPGETAQDVLTRYQNDYHSDDKPQVLAAIQAWASGTPADGAADSTNWGSYQPTSQDPTYLQAYSRVVAALRQAGFNPATEDPNYWTGKMLSGDGYDYIGRIMRGPNDPSNNNSGAPAGGTGQSYAPGGGNVAPTYAPDASISALEDQLKGLWGSSPTPGSKIIGALPTTGPALGADTAYTPGTLGAPDLPWDYNSLMAELSKGGPLTPEVTAALKGLLAGGGSMPPALVDKLKAQEAETLQQAALGQKRNASLFGAKNGLQDSPWLGAQESAIDQNYDAQIAHGATGIDTEAAKTNWTDRLNAATAAAGYDTAQGQQHLAAVQTAVNASIQKAAATKDVFALNESLKQTAAQLGISRAQLVQQYVLAMTGFKVDAAKLDEQSSEFQADLLFRIQSLATNDKQFAAKLAQDNSQFGANLGLNYDQLNEKALEAYWNQTTPAGSGG